jgi:hypothetical protein
VSRDVVADVLRLDGQVSLSLSEKGLSLLLRDFREIIIRTFCKKDSNKME